MRPKINPATRGMQSRWLVHEGQPSWHQARAGHISAAATVYSGDDAHARALAHAERAASHHLMREYRVREELTPILGK